MLVYKRRARYYRLAAEKDCRRQRKSFDHLFSYYCGQLLITGIVLALRFPVLVRSNMIKLRLIG